MQEGQDLAEIECLLRASHFNARALRSDSPNATAGGRRLARDGAQGRLGNAVLVQLTMAFFAGHSPEAISRNIGQFSGSIQRE